MIALTQEDIDCIVEDVGSADEFMRWEYTKGNPGDYSFFDLLHACRRRRRITKILTKEADHAQLDQ